MAKREGKGEMKLIRTLLEDKIAYGFIAISFMLFLLTRISLFALFSVIGILFVLVAESLLGASEHGWKKEAAEVGIAVLTALAIWYGLGFVLSTSAPLNAVVSCSMLPNLQRGDLVILQGSPPSAIGVDLGSFDYTDISVHVSEKGEFRTNMSLFQYCTFFPASIPCKALSSEPEKVSESYGPIEFRYGRCSLKGTASRVPCVKSIRVAGREYLYMPSGDAIVYRTLPTDTFSGTSGSKEIIHRTIFTVRAGEDTFYLTKGDNNDRFDIQYGNAPATPDRTAGKVIFRVPYVGYFKLFLFGFIEDPAGCDRTFEY